MVENLLLLTKLSLLRQITTPQEIKCQYHVELNIVCIQRIFTMSYL